MEVSDGEFTWSYTGDEPIVESKLIKADNYLIQTHSGPAYDVETETGREQLREAPPEQKFRYAKRLLGQVGAVFAVEGVEG